MSLDIDIRPETPNDHAAIRMVHRDAFGPDEPIPALVDGLRALTTKLPTISLVATTAGKVAGHVMLSHGWLDAPRQIIDVYVLSPLGVATEHHRQGIGKALIKSAINAATTPLVFLEGNPKYYAPRGFEKASDLGFRTPSLRIPDPAFQVYKCDGYTADMTGTLVYPDIFWQLDCVGLR